MECGFWNMGQFYALSGVSYLVATYYVGMMVGLVLGEAILKAIKMGEMLWLKKWTYSLT